LKSGSLNLLEPLGPIQACTGIALPLTFTALHFSGITITHLQEHKTVTTAYGNNYTVIDRVKFY
jgi:hypothetical protein